MESDSALPETNTLYAEIVDINTRPDSQDRKYAMRAMQWVLFAREDITIDELARAISVDRDGSFDEELDGAMLLDICSNLILIDKSGLCRLAHISIKGYILRIDEVDSVSGLFTEAQIHAQMAERCLCYLTNIETIYSRDCNQGATADRSFTKYALFHWAHHCDLATLELRSVEPLRSLFSPFMNPKVLSSAFAKTSEILQHDFVTTQRFEDGPMLKIDEPAALSVRSRFKPRDSSFPHRLLPWNPRNVDSVHDPNVAHGLGTPNFSPIFVAASFGFMEVLEETYVDDLRSKEDYLGWDSTHFAACNGMIDVLTYLLTINDLKPSRQDQHLATPVMLAAFNGHLEATKLLLAYVSRVDLRLQNLWRDTALHLASYRGNISIVRELLEHLEVSDLMTMNGKGQTPLQMGEISLSYPIRDMTFACRFLGNHYHNWIIGVCLVTNHVLSKTGADLSVLQLVLCEGKTWPPT